MSSSSSSSIEPKIDSSSQAYKQMSSNLASDVKKLRDENNALKKAKEDAEVADKAQKEKMRAMESHYEKYKQEHRARFTDELKTNVTPFLQRLKDDSNCDSKIVASVDEIESELKEGADQAFLGDRSDSVFQIIRAAASVATMQTGRLEELFTSQKQYEAEAAQWELAKIEYENSKKAKEDEYSSELTAKQELIAKAHAELEELHKKYKNIAKNVNNVENHFEGSTTADDETSPVELDGDAMVDTELDTHSAEVRQQMSIAATASSGTQPRLSGFDSLFADINNTSWRNTPSTITRATVGDYVWDSAIQEGEQQLE